MLHQLTRLFRPSAETQQAYLLYATINKRARQPHFFTEWHVPDTLDGRFELIVLHMFIYLQRLKRCEADTTSLQQRTIEAFFEDMDRSMREMGVGDTGVSKRVKNMANALYGRLNAYTTTLDDRDALAEALRTNLYGTLDTPPKDCTQVIDYIHETMNALTDNELFNPEPVSA